MIWSCLHFGHLREINGHAGSLLSMVDDKYGRPIPGQRLVPGLPRRQRDLCASAAAVVVARRVVHTRGVQAHGLVTLLEDGARVSRPCLPQGDGVQAGARVRTGA